MVSVIGEARLRDELCAPVALPREHAGTMLIRSFYRVLVALDRRDLLPRFLSQSVAAGE